MLLQKALKHLPRLQLLSKEQSIDLIQDIIVIAGNEDNFFKLWNYRGMQPVQKVGKHVDGIRLWELWIGKVASVDKQVPLWQSEVSMVSVGIRYVHHPYDTIIAISITITNGVYILRRNGLQLLLEFRCMM
jgi:hypothetical protein